MENSTTAAVVSSGAVNKAAESQLRGTSLLKAEKKNAVKHADPIVVRLVSGEVHSGRPDKFLSMM